MKSYFPEHLKSGQIALPESLFGGKMDNDVESFLTNALGTFIGARDEEGNCFDV